jgi:hypothetical protein
MDQADFLDEIYDAYELYHVQIHSCYNRIVAFTLAQEQVLHNISEINPVIKTPQIQNFQSKGLLQSQ